MFVQVQDVKLNFHRFIGVGDLEEKPLRVAIRVDIVLEEQVVLVLGHLRYQGQISTLESRFENEGLV